MIAPSSPRLSMRVCFCTLAIHPPYRTRALRLFGDPIRWPWVVLTDEPDDFVGLPVRAIRHEPTGPMAVDYLRDFSPTGEGRGAAAYHDKRFAVQAALEDFDTAIFVDADTRLETVAADRAFPPGLAVLPVVRKSVAEHLETCGSWRLPAFLDLAVELTGGHDALHQARWCHESCYGVTKDGNESRFFEAWGRSADFLQRRGVYSGEGGVMGLAAACAGWATDYEVLPNAVRCADHEGGGPKSA